MPTLPAPPACWTSRWPSTRCRRSCANSCASKFFTLPLLAGAAALAAFTASVRAEEAKPDNETSFNAAVTSDYLHAGRQRVRNNTVANYSDRKAGVTKDLGFASVQLAAVGTTASKTAYASPASGKFLGRDALQLTLGKTF